MLTYKFSDISLINLPSASSNLGPPGDFNSERNQPENTSIDIKET